MVRFCLFYFVYFTQFVFVSFCTHILFLQYF